MGVKIDKMTVTFYGDEECEKIADKFRALVKKKYKSMNDALKEIIKKEISQG